MITDRLVFTAESALDRVGYTGHRTKKLFLEGIPMYMDKQVKRGYNEYIRLDEGIGKDA